MEPISQAGISCSCAFGRLETKERLASHLKHASTLFCCKTVKYNSVLSQNGKIRYFLSQNVKIRAMSQKNDINCAASWLRILCCSATSTHCTGLHWSRREDIVVNKMRRDYAERMRRQSIHSVEISRITQLFNAFYSPPVWTTLILPTTCLNIAFAMDRITTVNWSLFLLDLGGLPPFGLLGHLDY